MFAPGDGSDTITDFNTDDDTINLSAFGDDISFDDLTITADHGRHRVDHHGTGGHGRRERHDHAAGSDDQ